MENEKLESSCADISLDSLNKDKLECMKAPETDESLTHPTPEQLLIREAVKYLTPKQRKVWEYSNYDKLTQDEIAKKLKITQQAVTKHLQAIEKRIKKWCKSNMTAYKLLKEVTGE